MSAIEIGSKFLFHDARGVRGPYVVEDINGVGADGLTPWCRLKRDGTEKVAWATQKWLREGINPRGVGWESVE